MHIYVLVETSSAMLVVCFFLVFMGLIVSTSAIDYLQRCVDCMGRWTLLTQSHQSLIAVGDNWPIYCGVWSLNCKRNFSLSQSESRLETKPSARLRYNEGWSRCN